MTYFIDLILDNGELIRVQAPEKVQDVVYEAIEHALKRHDWWCPMMIDGCTAEYLGHSLDRVNMGRVVGAIG